MFSENLTRQIQFKGVLAPIDGLSVVRSHISLSELKAMGKPFINVMLGR